MNQRYVFRLFVAGASSHSAAAEVHLRELLQKVPKETWQLEVIDVGHRPDLAAAARIVAIPTLVRDEPPPVRWIIGDLSDLKQVAAEMEIEYH